MEINKSSRHQKIIGHFGEQLICNFLSRSGFEVTIIDHTGIDILAYCVETKKRIGITVKSRTRAINTEDDSVNLFSYRNGKNDRQKILDACQAFACEPWIGIYVEKTNNADIYITSLDNYDKKYRGIKNRAIDGWKMGNKYLDLYENDSDVKHIHYEFNVTNWTWNK